MPCINMTDLTFDVEPLYRELQNAPWNEIPFRTNFEGSPHREVSDIWVRYNALENYYRNPRTFNDEHESVWYPVVNVIPQARLLTLALAAELEAERIGAVLITKIPPGGKVYPHVDPGWHARYYEKFIIQVRGDRRQAFCFEGESLSALTGECYWFDNQYLHWVDNDSDQDRISLIICLRREQCH